MELVEAGVGDLDALVQRWFSLATMMEAYDDLNVLVYAIIEDLADDPFRAHLDDEKVTDYLVVHDDETIGFITLREGHHTPRQCSRYLHVVNLATDEAHRNQGHGTAVVGCVKDMARHRGCDHLTISYEWDNDAARRFYREMGLRPKQVEYAQPLE